LRRALQQGVNDNNEDNILLDRLFSQPENVDVDQDQNQEVFQNLPPAEDSIQNIIEEALR